MKTLALRSGLHLLALSILLGSSLLGCAGAGGGDGSGGGNAQGTPLLVNVGGFAAYQDHDFPSPIAGQIVSFQLTIESVVLRSPQGDVTVFSTPRTFELSRLSTNAEPLLLGRVAQGNYNGIVIGVSNPRISFVDSSGVLHENVLASLASPTAMNPSEFTIDAVPRAINLAPLASIGGSNEVTVTPMLSINTQGPFSFKDLLGRVVAVEKAGSSTFSNFTLDTANNSTFTFARGRGDTATSFQGFDGNIRAGMIVEVSANNSDGTRYFFASTVKLEQDNANAIVVEGPALALAPGRLQMMVRQVHGPDGSARPVVGKALAVDANASTLFLIDSRNADLKDLGFTPTFDFKTIVPGQNIRATSTSGSGTAITADRLKLQEQSLDAFASTVTAGAVSGQYSVLLTLADDSAFSRLTGHRSLIVTLQPSTQIFGYFGLENCVTCVAGGIVHVRGLLFFSGGEYRLVATMLSVG